LVLSGSQLWLRDTKVTDAGLKDFKDFPHLSSLDISGTEVTDAGLKNLQDFKKLRSPYIEKTKVTDAAVADLQKALPDLEIIRGPRRR
jgi:internalin A